MTGLQKAAILLMTLGEELAGEVLKHMRNQEIQKITATMVSLDHLKKEDIEQVINDYLQTVSEHSLIGLDGGQFMKTILSKTLGEDRAQEVMDNFFLHGQEEGLEAIRMMDPRVIVEMVRREHPQVIAFLVATLDTHKAANVLEYLPEELQSEVVFRISTMQDIHPEVLVELEEAMRNQVSSNTGIGFNLGGVKFAAEIINRLDNTAEKRILEEVREIEESISEQIEEQLFVFDDIIGIDDRTMQTIIKEVDTDLLSMALRGTEEAMQAKFFSNMSTRASGIIKEQMELMGPVRLKDVERSQLEVVKIVKGLESEGKIVLGGKGGSEEFV